MANRYILLSGGMGAIPDLLDELPATLQLLYVPTAANVEQPAPWADLAREALAEMGFQIDDLDLATASADRVAQAVAAADVIFVGGGNTYYLLDQVNRSGFREALAQRDDVVYAGGSAGAIIAGPDIGFIGDHVDDPSQAPDLSSTAGLGLVDFAVLPHIDNESFTAGLAKVRASLPAGLDVVELRDDQAVFVEGGERRIVESAQ